MEPLSLSGKKGLIIGIANEHSIAYGCARVMSAWGAEMAATYLNKTTEPYMRPLAEALHCPIIMPCDLQQEDQVDALFNAIESQWGKLDFLLHSVAYAPKSDLQGRVTDCSLQGFTTAMDISCHSFIRLAKRAEPLMRQGGSLLTVSYYGSTKAVKHYNMMGPVKAALESAVRYMAVELGEKNIRVNAISPGAIMTRAASGIENFDQMLQQAAVKAALHRCIDLDDVGNMAAFLVSDLAKNITGGVHYIDAGYDIVD